MLIDRGHHKVVHVCRDNKLSVKALSSIQSWISAKEEGWLVYLCNGFTEAYFHAPFLLKDSISSINN